MGYSTLKGIAAIVVAIAVVTMSLTTVSSADPSGSAGTSGFNINTPVHIAAFNHYSPSWKSTISGDPTIIGPPILGGQNISVLLSLYPSNLSELTYFLSGISNPISGFYHHYLSQAQFIAQYSPSPLVYSYLEKYYAGKGLTITTYKDRMTMGISGTPEEIGSAFNTTIVQYSYRGLSFYGPTASPGIPSAVMKYVADLKGFSDFSRYIISTHSGSVYSAGGATSAGSYNGYLLPATYDGLQLIFGPDTQMAYQEQPLLSQYGYPTGQSEATILWSGQYTGSTTNTPFGTLNQDQYVGPFEYADIYSYYNETLPSGQPHSTVVAVPLNGAPSPGPFASYDSTGATLENTLDLEMLGSTAPGSTIYNVYWNVPTISGLDSAFSYILNSLPSVSVISNSWGSGDQNDTAWYNNLMEAQARGITVLVASGDSGDNTGSSKAFNTLLWYPATMAYDSFGDIAVGGTNLSLTNTLAIERQSNWYIPKSETALGGPLGTTSGVSNVTSEPSWQKDTSANVQISNNAYNNHGRGVPDISAIANNTLITISVEGNRYHATNATSGNPFYYVFGTSVACPVVAGIISEIDHVLLKEGQPILGFADPTIYNLGNLEYSTNPPHGTMPFSPVLYGHNAIYSAAYGYTLLNGWGTINAYNFTTSNELLKTYNVTFYEKGLKNGTSWQVTINGTSYQSSNITLTVLLPNGTYSYTASASSYTFSSNSTTFLVNGGSVSITVNFTAQPAGSPIEAIIILGVILVVILAIVGALASASRKRKRNEP